MDNILNGLSLSTILNNTSSVFVAIKPFLTFLLGVLLAILVINALIGFIQKKKPMDNQTDEEFEDYPEEDDAEFDDFDW